MEFDHARVTRRALLGGARPRSGRRQLHSGPADRGGRAGVLPAQIRARGLDRWLRRRHQRGDGSDLPLGARGDAGADPAV